MCIIDMRGVSTMSMVVGICSTNFCSFIADTRRIGYNEDDKPFCKDDHTSKIFKVNDRVLFGVAGRFRTNETLTAPIDLFVDKSAISLRTAYKAVVEYIEERRGGIYLPRNYLIGGKDNKGGYCIYEVHYDGLGEMSTKLRIPEPPQSNFGISCCIPNGVVCYKKLILNLLDSSVLNAKDHKDMVKRVSDVICKVADHDTSVNKNIEVLTVI